MNLLQLLRRLSATAAMAMALALCFAPAAQAELRSRNLVQLIQSSQSIVAGTVTSVTDGIDANGIPYTEVTLAVGISPKGTIGMGDYTFRQFGLLKPRTLPNGHRMLSLTPPDFPQWRENEYVVAFLFHPAAKTGLQTTAGLAQGKLWMIDGELANRFGNAGLFEGITVTPGVLSAGEQKVLEAKGPVKTEDLMGLIKHIVQGQLIERGLIK